MNREDRLKRYLLEIARHKGGIEAIEPAEAPPAAFSQNESLEAFLPEGMSSEPDPSMMATVDVANAALEKVKQFGEAAELAPEDSAALEAIILTKERPAVDILDGDFQVGDSAWLDLNADGDATIHKRLTDSIPLIGRIDLPGQTSIPFGGTGFVVGDGLIMTNRHVAKVFTKGAPPLSIDFKPGWQAAIDFLHERGRSATSSLKVRRVRMIHPYWDMALIEVEGLPANHPRLQLSLEDVADLDGRRVAVIGYPYFDPERNDVALQNQIFASTWGVKRLQPGRLGRRVSTASFGKIVSAATHDCSTLGGNSGSAVIDLDTGTVLALHFGGRYLETNYGVPAFELARDGRVVDAGVNFVATPSGGSPPWQSYWAGVETAAASAAVPDANLQAPAPLKPEPAAPRPAASASIAIEASGPNGISITVPLTISIRLGGVAAAGTESPMLAGAEAVAPEIEEKLAEVWHDTDYSDRDGYDPRYLDGFEVLPPQAQDSVVVAPLLDGSKSLNYRHFSIQMHALRRLALFTASNVTAEKALKTPEPGRKYDRKSLTGLGLGDVEKWFVDPRMAPQFQLSDKFFTKDRGAFDKGHIIRREDVAWGHSYDELRQGNGDTYHVTNCSPQIAQFNQSQRGEDNWGDLENVVLGEAASERLCLFAGPVLDPADQIFAGVGDDGKAIRVRIPQAFWKVVVATRSPTELATYAFVLDQDLSSVELEFIVPDNFRTRMVAIAELERRTGLVFPQNVRDADQFDDDLGQEVAFRAGLERTTLLDAEVEQISPNGGDDAEASLEAGVPPPPTVTTEAVRPWRLAEALKALRAQVNLATPNRSKASDGSIGDAAHQSRSSDHNPWVVDDGVGVVTAIDVTHDPAGGCDAGKLAAKIRAGADKRIKYVIWNRKIANREPLGGAAAWAWRPYNGANPHDHHVHISVRPEKQYYDAKDPWRI